MRAIDLQARVAELESAARALLEIPLAGRGAGPLVRLREEVRMLRAFVPEGGEGERALAPRLDLLMVRLGCTLRAVRSVRRKSAVTHATQETAPSATSSRPAGRPARLEAEPVFERGPGRRRRAAWSIAGAIVIVAGLSIASSRPTPRVEAEKALAPEPVAAAAPTPTPAEHLVTFHRAAAPATTSAPSGISAAAVRELVALLRGARRDGRPGATAHGRQGARLAAEVVKLAAAVDDEGFAELVNLAADPDPVLAATGAAALASASGPDLARRLDAALGGGPERVPAAVLWLAIRHGVRGPPGALAAIALRGAGAFERRLAVEALRAGGDVLELGAALAAPAAR